MPTVAPKRPNAVPRSFAAEKLLDEGGHLGGQQAAGEALHQARDDQHDPVRREAAQGAREGEEPDADDEHAATTGGVAEPPARDEQEPEGQRVARQDPLHGLRGRPGEARRDRLQRDVDDRHVEQDDAAAEQADDEGLPAVRVRLVA
nr:hypothetical protein [Curtobacterium sp. B18]